MTARVIVVGPRDRNRVPEGVDVVNTTSRSPDELWAQLSPFHLGPVKLWGEHVAKNVENGWQYSKVYREHTSASTMFRGDRKILLDQWLAWAEAGWSNPRAVRYPMGKGAVPQFSYWDGEEYDYAQARAKIYVPLYASCVRKTRAFKKLCKMHRDLDELYLWDFDGYDREAVGSSLIQVLTDPHRKMGHAFVLAMMLEWGSRFYLD